MRISSIFKVTRVHKAMTLANDTSFGPVSMEEGAPANRLTEMGGLTSHTFLSKTL